MSCPRRSLAGCWRGGNNCYGAIDPAIEKRLHAKNIQIEAFTTAPGDTSDATQTASLARNLGTNCIVVDGYCFGARYQATLKAAGLKLLFIDDNGHSEHYSARYRAQPERSRVQKTLRFTSGRHSFALRASIRFVAQGVLSLGELETPDSRRGAQNSYYLGRQRCRKCYATRRRVLVPIRYDAP